MDARRAGTHLAANATPDSTNAIVPNVNGSALPKPNSKFLNGRADPIAQAVVYITGGYHLKPPRDPFTLIG